mgnify:CR=1 FL=1
MTASADRLGVAGPRPQELWLTVGLSILLHGILLATIILMPRFRVGTYITVPVSYQVDLISPAGGGSRGGGSRAPSPAPVPGPARPPAPARPATAPRSAPPPSEELTLPGRRPTKRTPVEVEPSLRPPGTTARDSRPSEPVRAQPAPIPVPGPPVTAVAPPAASPGQGGGIELANGEKGGGVGASALGYYLGLVDSKISGNWIPLSGGGSESAVVIRFQVFPSGQVRNVELETSSGSAALDAAAMRAVRQSLPLPPFPNLLTEPYLNLRYRFVTERG